MCPVGSHFVFTPCYSGLTPHPAPTGVTVGVLGLCGLELQTSVNEGVGLGLRSIGGPRRWISQERASEVPWARR